MKPTVRKGKPVSFTLDYDADALLRAMRENTKSLGAFVSELVRKEARERAQRPALLQALAADAVEERE